MEALIFCGLQAAGKSSFYKERFFNTHLRINHDMLKTNHREARLLQVCLDIQQSFVIDKTNPTVETRAHYIGLARRAGFRVEGYYFQSRLEDCLRRNRARPVPQQIPDKGLFSTYHRLQPPTLAEGFDALYYVRMDEANQTFVVKEWSDGEQPI